MYPYTAATEGIAYDRVAKSMYYSEASGRVREFPWSARNNVTYDWNRGNIGRGPIGRVIYSDPNCDSNPSSDDCLLWTLGLEVFYKNNQIGIDNSTNTPIFEEQSYLIIAANNKFFPANDGTQQCAVIIKNMQTKKTYKIHVPSRDLVSYPCFANDVTITYSNGNTGVWVSDMIGYQTSYANITFDAWGNITHDNTTIVAIDDPQYTSASGVLIAYDPSTALQPGGHQFQGTNGMEVLNPFTKSSLMTTDNTVFYMAAWPSKMTRVEILSFSPTMQLNLSLVNVDYVSEIQGFDGLIMIGGSDALGEHRILHTGTGIPGHGNNAYKVVDNYDGNGTANFKVLMKIQPEVVPGQSQVCTTVAHNLDTDEIATICNNNFGPPPYNTASYTSKLSLAVASSRPQMRYSDFSYSNRALEYHEELDMVLLGSSSYHGIGVVGIPNAMTENDFTADYPSDYDVVRIFTPQDSNKKCNQIIYMQTNPINKCHLWLLCSTVAIDSTSFDQSYPLFTSSTNDVGLGMVDICDLTEPKTAIDWYVPLNDQFNNGIPLSFAISPNHDNTVDIFVLEQVTGIIRIFDVYASTANTSPRVEIAITPTTNDVSNGGLAGVAVDSNSRKLIWMTQNDGLIYVQSITSGITSKSADAVIGLGTNLGNQNPTRLPQGIKFNSDFSYLFVPTGSPSASEETWMTAVKFGSNWESATIAARFHLDCRQPISDGKLPAAKTILDFPTAVIFPKSNIDYNLHNNYDNQSPYGEDLLMLCSGHGYLGGNNNEYVTMVRSANYMTTLTNNVVSDPSVCSTNNVVQEDQGDQDDAVIGLAVAFSIMSVVVIYLIGKMYFNQTTLSRPSLKGRPSSNSATQNPMATSASNI